MEINQIKEALFNKGKATGFTDMEVYYQRNSKFSGKVFKGEVDTFTIANDGGLSFRGLYNGKMGYSYTEKIDPSVVDMLISEAINNASVLESEDNEVIFPGAENYHEVSFYSDDLSKVSGRNALELLKSLEEEVYQIDSRVKSVMNCQIQIYETERIIANTKGLFKTEKSNLAATVISVVAKDGNDTTTGMNFIVTSDPLQLDVKKIAKEVVEEALSYFGADSIESNEYPIILKNSAAASLLQAFVPVFSAENVQHGQSLLKEKFGVQIANPNVTIIDDPFLPNGLERRSFDSEGVPTSRLELIKDGILLSLAHNLKTAAKDGVTSTGHGYKRSYKGSITVAPSNLFIQPGESSYDELVESLPEGIIITSVQGIHSGANAISGDFSLAAHGYYVKEGKVTRPVNQITIAGNFYELLKSIETIGNDLDFSAPFLGGYIGSPSLKVTKLSVTGK